MIARPGAVADRDHRPSTAPDAAAEAAAADALAAAGLDPALAAANVVRRGGREHVFRAAVGAGLAVSGGRAGTPTARDALLDLVSLAGWRSGVLALRDDALARCEAMRWDERRASAAAAALGVEASDLPEFVERQVADRYWWPGRARANGYVWSVGGFAGFGDAWIRPADAWLPLDVPGAFAIRAADEWWRVEGDAWGARLSRLEGGGPADPGAQPPSASGVSIVLRAESHLAWLHVRDAA